MVQSHSSDQEAGDACLLSVLAHLWGPPWGPTAAAKQPASSGSNSKAWTAHIRLSCCEEYDMMYSWHGKCYLKKHRFKLVSFFCAN